ncbi:hypothetical protein [Micromonospora palomenae]|uniref:hypothetical protein n=1 Tax=Micromonospora palomenae TaxID=1461247 RepID=UPI003F8CEE99
MNEVLASLVRHGGGVVTWAVARQVVPEWMLRRACRAGHLVRVLPQVYVDARLIRDPVLPGDPVLARLDPPAAQRAALAYADGRAALSQLSALDVWGLRRQALGEPVHLTWPPAPDSAHGHTSSFTTAGGSPSRHRRF